MKNFHLAGIQQIGIGVTNLVQAKQLYAKVFGMDLPVFEDEAEAKLMGKYTGGNIFKRKASLLMNLNGGGGFELWQFTNRTPVKVSFKVEEGHLGISAIHLRSRDINTSYNKLKNESNFRIQPIQQSVFGKAFFTCLDEVGNCFKIVEDDYIFLKQKQEIGGVLGLSIGVSNPEKSLLFYQEVLGFTEILGPVEEMGCKKWRLKQEEVKPTAFGNLLGPAYIELVYHPEKATTHIYQNRFWGDQGFIHCCFDIQNMQALKENAEKHHVTFQVDSEAAYDMGDAAVRFAYVEDPDGTLIELVETNKVPIVKKVGWYLNLTEKTKFKVLPKWVFKVLALNRVRF